MIKILRRSAVAFDCPPEEITGKDGFQVVERYAGQKKGLLLIDLSHIPSWDIQDSNLDRFRDAGLGIPDEPCQIKRQKGVIISRLNQTQVQVWCLDGTPPAFDVNDLHCTEISDGQTVFALMGPEISRVFDTLTTLDLFKPGQEGMKLFQAPLFHIPSQILILDRSADIQVALISFPRGYGSDMAKAIFSLTQGLDLCPGGIREFSDWLDRTM